MNAAFFDAVRLSLFDGKLTQTQVDTIDTINAAWQRFGDKLGYDRYRLAYVLATALHEPGASMLPNTESLNYSVDALLKTFSRRRISTADAQRLGRKAGRPANQEAIANIVYGGEWGRENLGNTQPGDGWRFRGRGLAHLTGRKNYQFWSDRLGIDLIKRPERAVELDIAARILVEGMVLGTFTGKKLLDYINSDGCDYVEARRIVNGTDKAALIADYAKKFEAALGLAGTTSGPQASPIPIQPRPEPAKGKGPPVGIIITVLVAAALVAAFFLIRF